MADSISDADKVPHKHVSQTFSANSCQIRNKRLAKLGGHTAAPKEGHEPESALPPAQDGSKPSARSEKEGQSEQKHPEATTAQEPRNPFSQLGLKEANESSPKINVTPIPTKSSSLKRDRPSSSEERPAALQAPSAEEWEDKALSSIFRISLDPEYTQDSQGHRLKYLSNSRKELEESEETVRLSTAILDQVLLEAASSLEKASTPIEYFMRCWKRVSRQHRALRKAPEKDPKHEVITEARRLCMSYCIFSFTMPEMFG